MDLTASGTFTWSGGIMQGTGTTTANGGMAIPGFVSLRGNRVLTNPTGQHALFSTGYAYLDLNNAKHLGMVQDMAKIGADFAAKTAYIQPEILKMDRQTIDKFIQQEPRLKVFEAGDV